MELNSNRHSVFSLVYYLVVCTKYRHNCITNDMLQSIKNSADTVFTAKGGKVLEFNGETDHVHLLVTLPPQATLATVVNTFKTVSSRIIRRDFKPQLKDFYSKPIFWSRSYCIVTAGDGSLDTLKKYIENQKEII